MTKKLVIFGACGFIGQEVARLSVAIGHDPVSIDLIGRPQTREPWTQGVRWIKADAQHPPSWRDELQDAHSIIICLPHQHTTHTKLIQIITAEAHKHPSAKLVYLSLCPHPQLDPARQDHARQAEQIISASPLDWATLRPGIAYDDNPLTAELAAAHTFGKKLSPLMLQQAHPMRVELIAMATLRAALEPSLKGLMTWELVAHYGDAMMIQKSEAKRS